MLLFLKENKRDIYIFLSLGSCDGTVNLLLSYLEVFIKVLRTVFIWAGPITEKTHLHLLEDPSQGCPIRSVLVCTFVMDTE